MLDNSYVKLYNGSMEEKTFIERFPITPNAILAQEMGVSISTVINRARKLGLQKDKEYLHDLHHEIGSKAIPKMRERGSIPVGESHYNWKGGNPWKRFADPRYIEWRNAVLERDNYICQKCGRKCRKNEKGLAAHHLQSYTSVPELRYEVSNGQTLCRSCHMKLHGKEYTIEMVPCACGCGTMIPNRDKYSGRPRRYVNHHVGKGPRRTKKHPRDDGTMIPCACGCGTMIKKIGARGTPISYAPGHVTRRRWNSEEWQGERREDFSKKMSAARKREAPRKRNEKGQFL